ncbi:MAG: EAL domain-containing protein [Lachnospiraceae bacterium]|nr:EAL domain-containing protein [Lachnospiraceae bacterium]
MEKIIYFDYGALIIFVLVLLTTIMRRMTRGKLNQMFIVMISVGIITTLADVGAVYLDNLGPGNVIWKHIFHTTYLYLHSLIIPTYIIYLAIHTDTVHKLRRSRIQQVIFCMPIAIVTVLMIVNCFHPVVYYLNEQDAYTRGDAFFVLYAVAIVYMIYGVYYVYHYRKSVSIRRLIALVSVIPLTAISVVIQFIHKELLVEMFANACAVLFICMMIQRPEERIDSETGLLKMAAYVSDVRAAFLNEKPIYVIMANVMNYGSLQDMLGYDRTVDLKSAIAEEVVALNRKYGLSAELYYLGNGKFRFVTEDRHGDKVEQVAQAMNTFMKEELQLHHMDLNLVSCVCVAKCPDEISDLDSLLAFGHALNERQHSGDVMHASEHYTKEYYDIMKDIDRIIESALANHKFEVYYQPIYSVKEERFHSAEALLRLKDDKYGFIRPDVIIEAAEKSGAIHRIGMIVLEEVCRFIATDDFKALGLDYIEINLSVAQCMHSNLANDVLTMLEKYQVKPEQINLEITETAASYSQRTMLDNLSTLTNAGIHFSLDDFGTGYSNMRRIASLPLYLVKLDKSFTDVKENSRMMIVLQNTINMIKAMNLQIVVEGVETEHGVKQFSDLECEYIQGYYYSKPVPKDDFIRFIKSAMDK